MGAQVRGVAQLTGLVAVKLSIASCMVGGLKAGCDCRVSYPQAATALLCYIQCHATSWSSSDWGLLPRVLLGAPVPDDFHGADNGWMDNTLVGGSGK